MLVASLVAKSARSSWAFIACDLEVGLFLLVFALPGLVLIQWIQMPKILFVGCGSLAFKRWLFPGVVFIGHHSVIPRLLFVWSRLWYLFAAYVGVM